MLERRSLRAPIVLGVTLIALVVTLCALWALGTLSGIFDQHVSEQDVTSFSTLCRRVSHDSAGCASGAR